MLSLLCVEAITFYSIMGIKHGCSERVVCKRIKEAQLVSVH